MEENMQRYFKYLIELKELSEKYRAEGNQKFKDKKFFSAIAQYNKALIFARNHPVRASLSYANRSAAHLQLGHYQHCLHSIELAEKHYPDDKIQKLTDRRRECEEKMQFDKEWTTQFDGHKFKLSYPANPKLPFFIDAIQLKENETYGKHLITTRNLKAGDVIAVIDPWRFPIDNPHDAFLMGCYNCFKFNYGDLFFGEQCCGALFCSSDCEEEHLEKEKNHELIHMVEKKLVDQEDAAFILSQVHATRLMLCFHDAFGCVENMLEFYETHKNKKYNIFDFDWNFVSEAEHQKKLFLCVMAGQPRDDGEAKRLRGNAHVIFNNFKTDTKVEARLVKSDPSLQHFVETVVYQVLIALESNIMQVPTHSTRKILAIYNHPALFLLNHSCDPNIHVHFEDRKRMIWTVNQPLRPGDQLFMSYGEIQTFYYRLDKDEKCHFKDTCVPCKEGWAQQFDSDLFRLSQIDRRAATKDGNLVDNVLASIKLNTTFINNVNFKRYAIDPEKRLAIAAQKSMLRENLNFLGAPFAVHCKIPGLERLEQLNFDSLRSYWRHLFD